jgi:hypothetical protein
MLKRSDSDKKSFCLSERKKLLELQKTPTLQNINRRSNHVVMLSQTPPHRTRRTQTQIRILSDPELTSRSVSESVLRLSETDFLPPRQISVFSRNVENCQKSRFSGNRHSDDFFLWYPYGKKCQTGKKVPSNQRLIKMSTLNELRELWRLVP